VQIDDGAASGPYYGTPPVKGSASGFNVWFFNVTPGQRTVTLFDPEKRPVTSKRIEVRPASELTAVVLQLPYWAQ